VKQRQFRALAMIQLLIREEAGEVNHCMRLIFGLSAKLRFPKLMTEKKIIFC
jgi:hypothetical protein